MVIMRIHARIVGHVNRFGYYYARINIDIVILLLTSLSLRLRKKASQLPIT